MQAAELLCCLAISAIYGPYAKTQASPCGDCIPAAAQRLVSFESAAAGSVGGILRATDPDWDQGCRGLMQSSHFGGPCPSALAQS